jgi:hypothetical protein
MRLRAAVTWSDTESFDDSRLIDIVLTFENGSREDFSGRLKCAANAKGYLEGIFFYARARESMALPPPIVDQKQMRVYESPVAADEDCKRMLKGFASRLQQRHFIAPRNEWVTDEEYCAFFGSSGGIWETGECYRRGDFVEQIRQTVYDMEHVTPQAYRWSNVPKESYLREKIAEDKAFAAYFTQHIKPLIDAAEPLLSESGDIDAIKKALTEIADVTERYGK